MDDCDHPSADCGRGIRSPLLSATEDGTRKRHRWASRRHRQPHSLLSTTGQSRILTPFSPDFFPVSQLTKESFPRLQKKTNKFYSHYLLTLYRKQYEDMPQSLRTLMLFSAWLIDWISVAGTFFSIFCRKPSQIPSLFLFCTGQDPYAYSRLRLAEVGRFVSGKCSIFKVRRLWSKNGERRLWGMSLYSINQSINHWIRWERADFEVYPRTVVIETLSSASLIGRNSDAGILGRG